MRFLYIFPHPDDESFGPALAISVQRRQGHEVNLLTLTRGGATKQRHRLGYTIEQMGEVRYKEMLDVARVLDLTNMTVLDLPDGKLAELDPRTIENIVEEHIAAIRPDIVVTYPVHGISGFHDHLITHGIVKRVYSDMGRTGAASRRLAFFTLRPSSDPEGPFKLSTSTDEQIDCAVPVTEADVTTATEALSCYRTYAETITQADPLRRAGKTVYFEIFGEDHDPWLDDLTKSLSAVE